MTLSVANTEKKTNISFRHTSAPRAFSDNVTLDTDYFTDGPSCCVVLL